jgi:hypothetical protein
MELFSVVAVETVECVEAVSEVPRAEVVGVLGTRGRASMFAIVIDGSWLGWVLVCWMVRVVVVDRVKWMVVWVVDERRRMLIDFSL